MRSLRSRDAVSSSNATGITLDTVLDLLAARVAEKIGSVQGAGSSGARYTSKAPPPGMSRKRFNEVCRELRERGDARVHKVGRVWIAAAEAFENRRAKAGARALEAPETWSPEAALESAGIRSTRR